MLMEKNVLLESRWRIEIKGANIYWDLLNDDTVLGHFCAVSYVMPTRTFRGWHYDYFHSLEEKGGTERFSNLSKVGQKGQL